MRPVVFALVVFFMLACVNMSARGAVVHRDVYEKVEEANRLLEEEKHEKSLSVLDSIDLSRLNSYEKTLILNMRAHIYSQSGRSDEGLEIYLQLIESRGIPEQLRRAMIGAVANIHFSGGEYRKALDFIDSSIRNPSPSEVALKGFCFYKLGDYPQAARLMERAVGKSNRPPESWLTVLQSSYKETKEEEKRVKVVEKLAQFYPVRRNLLLLSSLYAGRGQAEKQMAVLRLVYETGELKKEKYLLLLSRLMFNRGLFFEAARVVEKGIKDGRIEKTVENFEFLSRSYLRSKERQKAVSPLKEAAKIAENNKPCIELADTYRILEKWKDSVAMADRCLTKPDGGENHRVHVIKGRSLFNLGKLERASEEFSRAREFKESETIALRWLLYIEGESKRRKRLSEAGIKRRRRQP